MKYRYVGKSGLLVSRLSLGTMTFGAPEWGCDEKTAHRIMDIYQEHGGNFVDCANNYAGGESERIIGTYLARTDRSRLVVASKCFFPQGTTPAAYGLSRKHILHACEQSLRRLQTDYLDLYYVHAFDPYTPLEETMQALDQLVSSGKVRYIGCSNLFAWQFTLANGIAAQHDRARFICGQHMYNLIHRDVEDEVLPACSALGMSLIAWSPLGGGMLTGKYTRAAQPEQGSRMFHRQKIDGPRFWHERGFDMAEELARVAEKSGIDRLQLALGWVLREPRVASVICGVRSVEQLESNVAATDVELDDEVYSQLNSASATDPDYLVQFARHSQASVFGAHTLG
ncbi:MAG: aldo/keto reductase [Spirochaetaceae bacterium]|nr:MAG: aldo/keto reductase [Spirochaetaceae bacterium]